MAERKNQHFVPQFLLRNFSDNGKQIGVYNISNSRYIPRASLRKQACKRNFYGRDKEIEKSLSIFESKVAPIIRNIIKNHEIPKRESEEYYLLLLFVANLLTRTEGFLAELQENIDKFYKSLIPEIQPELAKYLNYFKFCFSSFPPYALELSIHIFFSILDLNCKLIQISSPNEKQHFVISDHPVIHYNKFTRLAKKPGGTEGFCLKGTKIFVPLPYKLYLILYDRNIYKVGNRYSTTVEASEADIFQLNKFQCLHSFSNIYLHPELGNECFIKEICKGRREVNRYEVDKLFSTKGNSILLAVSHLGLGKGVKLNLSFIKLTKKAKRELNRIAEDRKLNRSVSLSRFTRNSLNCSEKFLEALEQQLEELKNRNKGNR